MTFIKMEVERNMTLFRCVCCFAEMTHNSCSELAKSLIPEHFCQQNPVKDELIPIFIIRKLLGIPKTATGEFLKCSGNPSLWDIAVCEECRNQVAEAFQIHDQIIQLEVRFRRIKEKFIECLKSSLQNSDNFSQIICSPVRDKIRLMVGASESELDEDFLISRGNGGVAVQHSEISLMKVGVSTKQEPISDDDVAQSYIFSSDDTFQIEGASKESVPDLRVKTPKVRNVNKTSNSNTQLILTRSQRRAVSENFIVGKRRNEQDFGSPPRTRSELVVLPSIQLYPKSNDELLDLDFEPEQSEMSCGNSDYEEAEDNRTPVQKKWYNKKISVPKKANQCKKVTCPNCKKRFDLIMIRNHFNLDHSVSLQEPHEKCDNCHLVFKKIADVETHKTFTHAENIFKCDKCMRIFNSQAAVTKHKGRNYRPWHCKICSARCCDGSAVKQHVKQYHPEVRVEKKRKEKEKKAQNKTEKMCEECGKILTSEAGYKQHMKKHKQPVPKTKPAIQCSVCEQYFKRSSFLKIHECRVHASELKLSAVSCPNSNCLKLFPDEVTLKSHIRRIHENEKKYVCEQCGQGFLHEARLNLHKLRHSDPKFECEQCQAMFYTKRDLSDHVIKHLPYAMRPCWCNICNKRFTCKTKLYIHRKIHVGGEQYACKICDKSFAAKNYLYCHMRNRHKEKKYSVCK